MNELRSGNGTSSSKLHNENAGFLTPRNVKISSQKPLFSDKKKAALGDVKNMAFVPLTPLKDESGFTKDSSKMCNENAGFLTPRNVNISSRKPLFSDKTKATSAKVAQTTSQQTTNLKEMSVPFATPQAPQLTPSDENLINGYKDLIDEWNDRIMLTDEQFEFLFMLQNERVPTPPPLPEPECPAILEEHSICHSIIDSPFYSHIKRPVERRIQDMDSLPPICFSPLNKTVNKISN